MRLRVTRYGEAVLERAGEAVTVFDDGLASLARDMIETMYAEEGVGLAAQQVGDLRRICVIDVSGLDPADLAYELDGRRLPIDLIMPMVLVNPEVRVLSARKIIGEEGCLSFPAIRGDVARFERIEVSFQDLRGASHLLDCSGWFARVVQHEVDHLNGVLFINRMDKRQLRLLDHRLRRLLQHTLAHAEGISAAESLPPI